MANSLNNYYGTSSRLNPVSNPLTGYYDRRVSYGSQIPGMVTTNRGTLPNGGGSYNPSGEALGGGGGGSWGVASDSGITPAPVFTGGATTPEPPAAQAAPENNFYDKYKDPKTGEIMSPEEYAIYLGNKIPKGTGEIPNYAGDAMTNPNETANQLAARATNLNNSRNDIATGTTDPYKAGSKSGIAYSPAELRAIEKAYAGIYDPVLNDVFARMSDKKKEEAKIASREDRVFATNESIRQWRATTGTKDSGGSKSKLFTQSQLNDGASNSGLSIASFASLDDDIKNFYINPPMALNDEEKKVPIYKNFEEDFDRVLLGELDADQLSEDILGSTLPSSVKHYFIEQIPAQGEKKDGWFKSVWGAITGK